MNEDFLHYLWQYRLFSQPLVTQDGDVVEVVSPGVPNTDSGPDFTQCRLRIGNTLWAGNVEIHLKTSDWFRHGHQHDIAYDNIILHLVYENDLLSENEMNFPVCEIKGCFDNKLFERYEELVNNLNWVPCEKLLQLVPEFSVKHWLERMAIERLMKKTTFIRQLLDFSNNSWEHAFYIHLMRNFGLKVNALPFEMLAKSLPLEVLARHRGQLMQIEALLFGQAGLLPGTPTDDYTSMLKKEYHFLRQKYNLQPLEPQIWKFMRLRPVNFPTIRIAHFAILVSNSHHLFSKILEISNFDFLEQHFMNGTSDYWISHYRFGKESSQQDKPLGIEMFRLIMINTVIPFVFYYGRERGRQDLCDKAIDWLTKLPSENNNLTRRWKTIGISPRSALESQGLIHLFYEYCSKKRCLHCAIGIKLLKNSVYNEKEN